MKTCNVCNTSKQIDEFNKATQNVGGLMHLCKCCEKAYRQSYKGKLIGLYKTQRSNSKRRNHPEPDYSFNDFMQWAEANNYSSLYSAWVSSGYIRRLAPSTDRLNDDLPYKLNNIQLTTWGANDDKAHNDFKSGKLNNSHTPIKQLTLSNELIAVFPSQLAASRATGVPQGNIGTVVRGTGRRHTAGGFKWELA